VHPRLDGWLLGGLGVVAWLVVRQLGSATAPITGVVSGAFLTTAAMHFGASYHLAYGDGLRSLRRHPFALVGAPLLLIAAAAAVVVGQANGQAAASAWLLRALLVSVFTLTGWHYVKQAYGVGMLSARSRGMRPTKHEVLVLRYGLYPVWLYDVLEIYGRGRNASYGGYDVTVSIVPAAWQPIGRVVAIVSLTAALAVMVRLALRARTAPPLGLIGAYVAGGLWFIAPPGYVSAALVLAGIHGIQYLTCAHRAEVDLAVERREQHLVHRWLCVFGGAAAGGLLLTTWLPEIGGATFASAELPNMIGVLVFAFFNLHHYAVDAVIWRSGGDHVVRMSKGPQPAPLDGEPTPGRVPTPVGAPVPSLA
jgi:hypothetical protein